MTVKLPWSPCCAVQAVEGEHSISSTPAVPAPMQWPGSPTNDSWKPAPSPPPTVVVVTTCAADPSHANTWSSTEGSWSLQAELLPRPASSLQCTGAMQQPSVPHPLMAESITSGPVALTTANGGGGGGGGGASQDEYT